MTTLTYLFLIVGSIPATHLHKRTLIARYYLAVIIPGLSLFLFQQRIKGIFFLSIQVCASFLVLIREMDAFNVFLIVSLFSIKAVGTVYNEEKKTKLQAEEKKSGMRWQQDN